MSFKAVYMMFAPGTFKAKSNLALGSPAHRSAGSVEALEKYAQRGWPHVEGITLQDQTNIRAPFHFGKRFVDDGESWVIPFDVTSLGVPANEPDTVAGRSFNLWCNVRTLTPEIRFVIVNHNLLSSPLVTNMEFGQKIMTYLRVLQEKHIHVDPHA